MGGGGEKKEKVGETGRRPREHRIREWKSTRGLSRSSRYAKPSLPSPPPPPPRRSGARLLAVTRAWRRRRFTDSPSGTWRCCVLRRRRPPCASLSRVRYRAATPPWRGRRRSRPLLQHTSSLGPRVRACGDAATAAVLYSYSESTPPSPHAPPVSYRRRARMWNCVSEASRVATRRNATQRDAARSGRATARGTRNLEAFLSLSLPLSRSLVPPSFLKWIDTPTSIPRDTYSPWRTCTCDGRTRAAATVAAAARRRRFQFGAAAQPVPRAIYADGRELVAETRRTDETASAPTAGQQLEAATVGGGGGGGDARNKYGNIVTRSSTSDLTLVRFGRLPTGHGAGCRTHVARVLSAAAESRRRWPRASWLVAGHRGLRPSSNLTRELSPGGGRFFRTLTKSGEKRSSSSNPKNF